MRGLQDERIINERRRISSNAFGICILGLLCILMYRLFILNQSSKEVWDIQLLLSGVTLYVFFNIIKSGIYLSHNKKKKHMKVFAISGAIAAIVFTIVFSISIKYKIPDDIPEIIVGAVVFFAVWMTSQIIFIKLSEKQANKDIEKG